MIKIHKYIDYTVNNSDSVNKKIFNIALITLAEFAVIILKPEMGNIVYIFPFLAIISASLGFRYVFSLIICVLYGMIDLFLISNHIPFLEYLSSKSHILIAMFAVGGLSSIIRSLHKSYEYQIGLRRELEQESVITTVQLNEKMEILQKEIIERHRAEAEIMESKLLFEDLVEKAGIGILRDNRDGVVNYANDYFTELTGIDKYELIGQKSYSFMHPEDMARVKKIHQDRYDGKVAPMRYEVKAFNKFGEIIYLRLTVVELKNNGILSGTRTYISDISDRVKQEELNLENEKRFRSIFENATIGIYRTNPEGKVIMANKTLLKMLKFPLEENEDIIDFRYRSYSEESRKELLSALKAQNVIIAKESELECYDGTMIIISESAWAVRDDDGELQYIDGLIDDITDKKQAEQERELLITQLMSAKTEIKHLTGLLPMCSSCKQIRDEAGHWHKVEEYIDDHSEAELSHGICPDCAERLYPNYLED